MEKENENKYIKMEPIKFSPEKADKILNDTKSSREMKKKAALYKAAWYWARTGDRRALQDFVKQYPDIKLPTSARKLLKGSREQQKLTSEQQKLSNFYKKVAAKWEEYSKTQE